MVWIGGEAGVGKTALVRRFCAAHSSSVRILWGACDALFTPRALGPLLDVAEVVPPSFFVAAIGLAVIGVLASALEHITRGPLLLGPMFAFAVALSDLSLFDLGPFFWALIVGLVASLLLEPQAWQALRPATSSE